MDRIWRKMIHSGFWSLKVSFFCSKYHSSIYLERYFSFFYISGSRDYAIRSGKIFLYVLEPFLLNLIMPFIIWKRFLRCFQKYITCEFDKPIELYPDFSFSMCRFHFQDLENFTIFVSRNYGVFDFEIIIIMFSGLLLVNLISKSHFPRQNRARLRFFRNTSWWRHHQTQHNLDQRLNFSPYTKFRASWWKFKIVTVSLSERTVI